MHAQAQDRSWMWEAQDWCAFAFINCNFLKIAQAIDSAENNLLRITHALSKQEQIDILAHEILANWNIEGIDLSKRALRESLSQLFNVTHKLKIKANIQEKHATEATYFALTEQSNLTLEHILQIHQKMKTDAQNDWGVIRKHPESVYAQDVYGNCYSVYDAPPAHLVLNLMQKFVDFWNQSLTRLPRSFGSILAHVFFVTIHPFRDGNGRVARLLADKYLAVRTKQILRPYSISDILKRNQSAYYMALESITEKNGLSHFLDFMLAVYTDAVNEAQSRITILLKIYAFLRLKQIQLKAHDKELLQILISEPKTMWSFFSATKDMEDGEAAECAWHKLCAIVLLDHGRLVIPD
ncbi:MAG: Fic family protein [Desulfovibrionaceae bacterium]|nr:Fic family protein [Desulfovibrionaceae bacterium]